MSHSTQQQHDVLLAFGSNLGDSFEVYQHTLQRLGDFPDISLTAHSEPVRTSAVGGPDDQPEYLNAAIRLQTTLTAGDLHQRLIEIETDLGRERRTRWGARKIDLDLLLFGHDKLETETLTIPHPRMSFRRFVLQPAAEIAGDMLHCACQMTITELITHLDSTPQKIVWVTEISPDVIQCLRQIENNRAATGWEIQMIDNKRQLNTAQPEAKLVAWAASLPAELRSLSLRGPQLKLPATVSKIKTELLAAMEAMQNL